MQDSAQLISLIKKLGNEIMTASLLRSPIRKIAGLSCLAFTVCTFEEGAGMSDAVRQADDLPATLLPPDSTAAAVAAAWAFALSA